MCKIFSSLKDGYLFEKKVNLVKNFSWTILFM